MVKFIHRTHLYRFVFLSHQALSFGSPQESRPDFIHPPVPDLKATFANRHSATQASA